MIRTLHRSINDSRGSDVHGNRDRLVPTCNMTLNGKGPTGTRLVLVSRNNVPGNCDILGLTALVCCRNSLRQGRSSTRCNSHGLRIRHGSDSIVGDCHREGQ